MPRVVHFDMSADDPERAIGFYREVFAWEIERWAGPFEYWLIKTGDPAAPGIDGGLGRRERPSDSTISIIDVPSVDEFATRIAANGGRIVQPKRVIPGAGYLVICEDTEGNAFGIMESDEEAS